MRTAPTRPAAPAETPAAPTSALDPAGIERLVETLRKSNRTFFGTALARATFTTDGATLTVTVGGNFEQQRCENRRSWIEETAQQVFGRRVPLVVRVEAQAAQAAAAPVDTDKERLKEQAALSDAVQAVLDVFPATITDVEEIN